MRQEYQVVMAIRRPDNTIDLFKTHWGDQGDIIDYAVMIENNLNEGYAVISRKIEGRTVL